MTVFRVEYPSGLIRGRTDATGEALARNLGEDQRAIPWAADVDPARHRWDFAAQCWVDRTDEPPAERWDKLRRREYPQINDQVGDLMELARVMLAWPEFAARVPKPLRERVEGYLATIDDVKRRHRKPST